MSDQEQVASKTKEIYWQSVIECANEILNENPGTDEEDMIEYIFSLLDRKEKYRIICNVTNGKTTNDGTWDVSLYGAKKEGSGQVDVNGPGIGKM